MRRSSTQRIELVAGILALVLCVGVAIWGFATNIRDSSPPSIIQEPGPEIVQDDIVGTEGIRNLTPTKLGFLGLLVLAGTSVAGGAVLHVSRNQARGAAGMWVGGFVLLASSFATMRTLGMPLLAAAMLAFIAGFLGSLSTIPSGVSPTRSLGR